MKPILLVLILEESSIGEGSPGSQAVIRTQKERNCSPGDWHQLLQLLLQPREAQSQADPPPPPPPAVVETLPCNREKPRAGPNKPTTKPSKRRRARETTSIPSKA